MADQPNASQYGYACSLSTQADTRVAFSEVADAALNDLGSAPDLALLFLSTHHAGRLADDVLPDAANRLGTERLAGCVGEAIVANDREIEGEPAMVLWLARLPGISPSVMHLRYDKDKEKAAAGSGMEGWAEDLPDPWPTPSALLLLGDPYSFPADVFLERLAEDHPQTPVLGGMASGSTRPGEPRLLWNDRPLTGGALAVLLPGLALQTVVSQGCRPIGRPLVITKAERNVIHQLGGKPALEQLKTLFDELPNRDKELVQSGLHVGRVVSEYQERFEQGDFLVRNVLGIDQENQAIHVGDFLRTGQTIQFHVRDQHTADQELRQLAAAKRGQAAAGLLFTCNGRGTNMFDQPNHDAGVLRGELGDVPLAGFFAQGELGPVAGRNFVHGFTASAALFPPGPAREGGG